MGREIEIKIPLEQDQYDTLFNAVKGNNSINGVEFYNHNTNCYDHLLKSDEYFSKYDTRQERKDHGEPQVIRIRTEKDCLSGKKESFFCIKVKKIENGIELNQEFETFVQDDEAIRKLMEVQGLKKFFSKQKESISVYSRATGIDDIEFHLELVTVNGLKYAETEVVQSELAADKVRAGLEQYMKMLGLDVSKRDSRSWMEILDGNHCGF